MHFLARTLALAAATVALACQLPTPSRYDPAAAVASPGVKHVTVPVGRRPVGMVASNGFVYVANELDKTISVIDTLTDKLAKTMAIAGSVPGGINAFLDRRNLMVLDVLRGEAVVTDPFGLPQPSPQPSGEVYNPGGVEIATPPPTARPASEVEMPTPRPVVDQVIQRVTLGGAPDRVVFADDNKGALFTLAKDKVVYLSFEEDDRWAVPKRREFAITALGVRFDVKGGIAVIPDTAKGQVLRVDIVDNKLTPLIETKRPGAITIGRSFEDGHPVAAIVGDLATDTLHVIDLVSGKDVVIPDAGKGPTDVVTNPELGRAFVTMADSREVAVIDYRKATLVTKIALTARPDGIAMAPPIPHEYWVTTEDGKVAVIDGNSSKIRSTPAIGKGAHLLTFWGTKGYVSNQDDNTVTAVERAGLR